MPSTTPEAMASASEIKTFAAAILHGDDEHRAWLTEAAEAFIAGQPMPPPRGKGTQSAVLAPPPPVPESVRRLSEAAFPGPWSAGEDDIHGADHIEAPWDGGDIICDMPSEGEDSRRHWPANRAFIVAAANHVRSLLAVTPAGRVDEGGSLEALAAALADGSYSLLSGPSEQEAPTPAPDSGRAAESPELAMRPFAACVFNDNGDVTVSTGNLTVHDWLRLDRAHRALDAAPAPAGATGEGRERVRHVKRGTEYEVLHQGVELQISVHRRLLDDWALALCEGDKLVIYRGANGKLWAREESEFRDGRFEPAPSPAGEA